MSGSTPSADVACKHERTTWDIFFTKGHCQDCGMRFAVDKGVETPQGTELPICPKCKGSGEAPATAEYEEAGLGNVMPCPFCKGAGETTFADMLCDALARTFRVAPGTVKRWINGESAPHPLGQESVLSALSAIEHREYERQLLVRAVPQLVGLAKYASDKLDVRGPKWLAEEIENHLRSTDSSAKP